MNDTKRDRPFWSLFGSTLSQLTDYHAIIIAGTHIGVRSEQVISSSLAKPLRREIITLSNFRFNSNFFYQFNCHRYNSKEETLALLSRILKVENFTKEELSTIATVTAGFLFFSFFN
jgi:hypothetical protein